MKRFYVILTVILSIFLLSSCFGGGASSDTDTDTDRNTESNSSIASDTGSDTQKEDDSDTSIIGGFGSDADSNSSANSDTPPPKKEILTVFLDPSNGDDAFSLEVEADSIISAPTVERAGYKFGNWLTEDGSVFDFSEPISSSFTLYASWLPDKNTVYFDANGGDGELAPIEATTESTITLPTPEFERLGYFFQGWSLDPNGTYDYYAGGEYTVTGEGNTLYAVWGKKICYIKYFCSGGVTVYEPFTYEDLPITLEKPSTDYGYCDGWFNATYDTEITEITELEDITVYQRWVGVHIIGGTVYSVDNIFESLTIPSEVEGNEILHIESKAFKGCDKLKTLVLPESIRKIGYSSFEGCTSLNGLSLPSSVSEIGDFAFKDCSSLTSLDLPTNLTALGSGAFMNCVSITEFTVPNSITALGHSTFDGCTGLEVISFGEDLAEAPSNNFSGCKKLNTINIDPNNTDFKSVNGNVLSANEKNLLYVAPAKSTIEDAIPSTVTTIGKDAFGEIEGLEHLVIPDHVKYIESSAFEYAPSIRTLDTGSLYTIPKLAFANMPCLVTLKINEATTVVGDQAFYNCRTLSSVTLEGEFSSFSDTAFEESNRILEVFNLTGVSEQYYGGVYRNVLSASTTLGPSLIEIYNDFVLFNHRDAGVELITYIGHGNVITLPDRDEPYYAVWEEAFKYCDTITEVIIPDTVTRIEDYAFYGCNNLKKVSVGKGVTRMSGASFYKCSNISEFIVDEENTSYIIDGEAIFTPDKTELVKFIGVGGEFYSFEIPVGVTTVGACAFLGADVYKISLPSTLINIGNEAFRDTRIGEFIIPSSVNRIGSNALDTTRLYKVEFETLYYWYIGNGYLTEESLTDPYKNAEYFGDSIWYRD